MEENVRKITPPHIIKYFLLKIQGFLTLSVSVNKPELWTFRCIWYWNSGKRVHEIKRHCFSLYWPCVYPSLYGS